MDYGQEGQACRQTFIYRITEGLPVIRPRSANAMRHTVNYLARFTFASASKAFL
jgi:hypothetical protein